MKFNYKAAALSPVVMLLLTGAAGENLQSDLQSESHAHTHNKSHHK
jgi:hypothetical protein